MSDVLVARIGKNVDRDDVVQAFIVNTVIESAVRDYMLSIGYSEDEYEISRGDRDEVKANLIDREVWFVEVSIDWGKASLMLV